jgi:multiple sugar transport system substrate-binding protein
VAKKLTETKGDSYSRLGFMPNYHDTAFGQYGYQWGLEYFDEKGKSKASRDPDVVEVFKAQKRLVDALGGYTKLAKYRTTFGDEFGPKNPFHTGQVAMVFDGEWRAGMAEHAGVTFDIGTAPMPVPDDQVSAYGRGGLSGTIIGIASQSEKQDAAWELVKFLTTNTDAVVNFSNAIHNVPSTFEALNSPRLSKDPHMEVFMDIAQHKDSISPPSTPDGAAYLSTLEGVGHQYESGKITDLEAALKRADKQIDQDMAHAG